MNGQRPAFSGQLRKLKGAPSHDGVTVGRTDTAKVVGGSVRVRECERVCACMRDVFAIYDDILPRLIMIIIKIIILHFIQIRYTDDFP